MSDYGERWRERSGLHLLYKDRENALVLGICAGIADYFDWNVAIVRVLTVISLFLLFIPTAVIYLLLGMLLKDKPLSYYGRDAESRFWAHSE